MEAFMSNIPQEIRNDIAEGNVPLKRPLEDIVVREIEVPNDEVPTGPGVPLPEDAGFDLSDEEP
jgi:hypothetical protein